MTVAVLARLPSAAVATKIAAPAAAAAGTMPANELSRLSKTSADMNVVTALKTKRIVSARCRSRVTIMVVTISDRMTEYEIKLRKVAPGSMLICPHNDGSFNAAEAVDQIGFTNEAKGSGVACKAIQATGNSIAIKNRFNSWIVVFISAGGDIAATASMTAVARAIRCCAVSPSAMAKTGVAASRIVKRRKGTIDKCGNFARCGR